MKLTTSIISWMSTNDFLVSFWSNFLSGLIITLLAWLGVKRLTNIFEKPDLILVVKQGGVYSDKVILSERADGNYEASFLLAIKNLGNKTIRYGEGYWHFYLKFDASIAHSASGEETHQRGLINEPVQGKSFYDLPIGEVKLTLKKEELIDARIPYFFATDYGNFPKSAKIDQKNGIVLFENMNQIEFISLNELIK